MLFYEERITRILQDLQELISPLKEEVSQFRYLPKGDRYADVSALDTSSWQAFDKTCSWGGHNVCAWFDTTVEIPASMEGQVVLFELQVEDGWDAINPQYTVYVDGVLRQGFDVNHRDLVLTECAKAGDTYRITLRAFSGRDQYDLDMKGFLKTLDREVEKYYYDLKVPHDVARLLPRDSDDYTQIITALTDSVNLLDMRDEKSDAFRLSLRAAQENLQKEFYKKRCGDKKQKIYCVGHTHIDVCWWWTLSVTRDKSVRSFSTVLENMNAYPDFLFMSSQVQLYKYVQQDAPDVYARIKERVREGRWEPEGAMYLEADCNLSSGESLVRQILYGKRFFRKEFGAESKIVWLPDVFGYSAALPQIMKKTGVDYFMTTKISWNEINKMPYDTFMWEGLDGTRILTHFAPPRDYAMDTYRHDNAHVTNPAITTNTTYNAYLNANQLMGAWQRYQQKDISNCALMTFGFGDGGGGPTKDMLENYKRLSKGIPGAPQAKMSNSLDFFRQLEKEVKDNRFLPAWVGELYLEYHRGTYTGIARNKRYNRKMEYAYQNSELYGTLAEKLASKAYPQDDILNGWEVIARNQFHDILPGSSIFEVYEDSKEEYEKITAESGALIAHATQAVANQVNAAAGSLVVYNPNSFVNNDVVVFDVPAGMESVIVMDGEKVLPTQLTYDGKAIFCMGAVPPKGYKTFTVREGECGKISITADEKHVSTPYYRVRFNKKAQFVSVYDKKQKRELIKKGAAANVIMTYEDKPHNYDAWDLNNYYTEKQWEMDDLSSFEVLETGAVRTVLRVERKYLDSVYVQDIIFYEHNPRIDFDNHVDWKQHHLFVKALFPVDIHAPEATYEVQYGHVKRPTHYNTSWDFARFEVCHHKWLDYAEDNYGVSMLNDCKYGAHVHDDVIGLSLLKCATLPNPVADQEHHEFTYSLLPHQGSWREAGTLQQAYSLNQPMTAVFKAEEGGVLPAQYALVKSSMPNVVVEVVKKAEDSDDTIVRVYEAYGRRVNATLSFAQAITAACECDLMEENETPVQLKGHDISFEIKPFEIRTFKVRW